MEKKRNWRENIVVAICAAVFALALSVGQALAVQKWDFNTDLGRISTRNGAWIFMLDANNDWSFKGGNIVPSTTATYSLGTATKQWKNATLSGTVTAGAFSGPVTGAVTGNITGNVTGNVTGNLNGLVGNVTPAAGTFTTVTANTSFSGPLNGTVGATTPAAGTFTTVTANTSFSGPLNGTVGATTPAAGTFTTLSATGTSTLTAGAAFKRVATATNYTALTTDTFIQVSDTTAARTITLPAAATLASGYMYVVEDTSGGAALHNITITPNGADTIDGAAGATISTNHGSVRLVGNGVSGWNTW